MIDIPFSGLSLRSCPYQPTRTDSVGGASAVCSHQKSRLSLPRSISFATGQHALLSFVTSRVSLPDLLERKHFPSSRSLSSLGSGRLTTTALPGPQGLNRSIWHFPLYQRAPTRLALLTHCRSPALRKERDADQFFRLRGLESLQPQGDPS